MSIATNAKPLRAVVIDDEPLARANITVLLRRDTEIEIIGEYGSGRDGLEAIRTLHPDLAFLDIQMPECDGFDIIELLGRDIPSAVVFVTAYDQYAIRAFEVEALDYLLKPFDDARFAKALARAKEKINLHRQAPVARDLFAVKNAGRVIFVRAKEIDWIEAADYYTCLHAGARTHLLRRTMNELARDLDQTQFCRIHRSAIVNLDRVQELTFGSNGEYEVVLKDQVKLRLSKRYRGLLRSRLRAFS